VHNCLHVGLAVILALYNRSFLDKLFHLLIIVLPSGTQTVDPFY